jgi:hypothetical protein
MASNLEIALFMGISYTVAAGRARGQADVDVPPPGTVLVWDPTTGTFANADANRCDHAGRTTRRMDRVSGNRRTVNDQATAVWKIGIFFSAPGSAFDQTQSESKHEIRNPNDGNNEIRARIYPSLGRNNLILGVPFAP